MSSIATLCLPSVRTVGFRTVWRGSERAGDGSERSTEVRQCFGEVKGAVKGGQATVRRGKRSKQVRQWSGEVKSRFEEVRRGSEKLEEVGRGSERSYEVNGEVRRS